MKRTEWNEEFLAHKEAVGKRNGEAECTTARNTGGGRTVHKRQANFNVELLHDAVWEGY